MQVYVYMPTCLKLFSRERNLVLLLLSRLIILLYQLLTLRVSSELQLLVTSSGTLTSPTPVLRPDNSLVLFTGYLTKLTPALCLTFIVVWDPHAKHLINKVEAVQRLAVRVLTKHWSASSTHMLSTHSLYLCPLQEQHVEKVNKLNMCQQMVF